MKKHLTYEEGLRLLHEYGTPEHVIGHCRAVCETAVSIAKELNKCGKHLDIEVIEGAAIIHDIARVEDEHWLRGAEYARNLGLDREAEIIAAHMHHVFNSFDDLDETDMVCLGDRTVTEDEFVGLDERIKYIMNKARRNGLPEEKVLDIGRRMEKNHVLISRIEEATGRTLFEICSKAGKDE